MQGIGGAALMLLQDDTGQLTHDVHLLTIFVGILAIAVLAVVIGLLIAGIAASALVGRAVKAADSMQRRAEPILDKTNELLIEFVPKLRTVSDNVEHISTVVRSKMDEVSVTVTQVNQTVQQVNQTVQQFNQTAQDANSRARAQVAHADAIMTDAVTATQEISHKVQHAINVPVRQVAGIVAAFKAGLETLIERSPFGSMRNRGPRSSAPGGAAPGSAVSGSSVPGSGGQGGSGQAGSGQVGSGQGGGGSQGVVSAAGVPLNPGRPYDV